jgi:D-glycero-alpha-D-manno-heptose 1-phosphate guanylyltransferase
MSRSDSEALLLSADRMADLRDCTAAILAGGLGTRLRSVVADRPKVLAEVRGCPFLTYLLEQLMAAGVREVVLCTGYLGEQVRETFDNAYGSLNLTYSQELSSLGTAGALRLALPHLQSDSILVMNGDSFCEANLGNFWAWHRQQEAEATLLLTQVPDTRRYGRVQIDTDGQLLSFEEKGNSHGAGWINAGIYLIKRQLLLTIPEHQAVSLEREVFPQWIGRGLYGYCSEGKFLDIGTPESYAIAERFFAPEVVG